ncbi:hypothetical protein GSU2397 [Geobacter sulfurreducens PCA]|uniref:Transposase n=1 Tax=Geobacter sulfurreducens (strain ATCC 51573 / DSM 12127 / PCA) TaxID=243231 RepID=Q74AZ9_GEOSL|nr:hypothetical protein GSU2397 [Geobacter sulfurreducens PCA]HCD97451.1 hypothetical protein [Geobacter sulfurreducens]
MTRIARVIATGIPHHVTQRGNRRMPTFFNDEDYRAYIALLGEWCRKCGVDSPGTQVTRVKDLSRSLKGGLP